jgi:hypothetical protein
MTLYKVLAIILASITVGLIKIHINDWLDRLEYNRKRRRFDKYGDNPPRAKLFQRIGYRLGRRWAKRD